MKLALKDASKQMMDYVDDDLVIAATNQATTGSIWTVAIDTATGKVTKVTYTKDGVVLPDLIPSASVK